MAVFVAKQLRGTHETAEVRWLCRHFEMAGAREAAIDAVLAHQRFDRIDGPQACGKHRASGLRAVSAQQRFAVELEARQCHPAVTRAGAETGAFRLDNARRHAVLGQRQCCRETGDARTNDRGGGALGKLRGGLPGAGGRTRAPERRFDQIFSVALTKRLNGCVIDEFPTSVMLKGYPDFLVGGRPRG
jgi:hypothetical protein